MEGSAGPPGLIDNYIYDIEFDSNDKLWIGTSEGLSTFYEVDWTSFTTENSDLPNNDVYKYSLILKGRLG